MLMLNCPSCHRRLPLTEVFGGGGIVCSSCNSELEPRSSLALYAGLILAILASDAVTRVAKGASLNFIAQLVSGSIAGIVIGCLAYALVVRYRIRETKGAVLKL